MFVRGTDQHGKSFVDFATALNISAGGALLVLNRRLQPETQVSLEIPVGLLPQTLADEAGATNPGADSASRGRREVFYGRRPVCRSATGLNALARYFPFRENLFSYFRRQGCPGQLCLLRVIAKYLKANDLSL